MKTIKKMIAMILAIVSILACFSVFAGAASISSNKHTATGIKGSQNVYIHSNTGWNANLPGYKTQIKITIPANYKEYYQGNGFNQAGHVLNGKKVQVNIYKKNGKNWVKQNDLSGKFACDGYSGVISYMSGFIWKEKTFTLSGKGVDYKVVVIPEAHPQMSGIKVAITSYGTITSVS